MLKFVAVIASLAVLCSGYSNHGHEALTGGQAGYFYGPPHFNGNTAVQVPPAYYGTAKTYNTQRNYYPSPTATQHGGYAPGVLVGSASLTPPVVVPNQWQRGSQWQQGYTPSFAYNPQQYYRLVPRPYGLYPVYQPGSYSPTVHHKLNN